ncbi:hypothetical protein Tco_0679609 [Tanacetum coccineum]|uniref:Uncharacterized protein n=1 Tax=Tanacetum coccineum TaxID=301880 RepID=A0ABQ4XJ23_9ASTR
METKDTLSSCSDSEEQQMQLMQDKAKESCMIYLDEEYVIMTHTYFLEYTQLEIREFCDTLIQHMESVKKSIDKRALHKGDSRDTRNSLGNDVDADDADIKLVYDKEPMAEVQLTADCNVSVIGQLHTEQPEFNNEGKVD